MRYYIYVSETKVDMLFPQIPSKVLKGLAAELKIDLGVVSTTLRAGGSTDPKSLFAKAELVSKYICSNEPVGTIEAPKRFFTGTHPMKWGVLSDYASSLAFFGGTIDNRHVALIGSRRSLVGKPPSSADDKAWYSVDYYTLKYLNQDLEQLETHDTEAKLSDLPHDFRAFAASVAQVPERQHTLNFLAKRVYTTDYHGMTIIVGPPIYVSLED